MQVRSAGGSASSEHECGPPSGPTCARSRPHGQHWPGSGSRRHSGSTDHGTARDGYLLLRIPTDYCREPIAGYADRLHRRARRTGRYITASPAWAGLEGRWDSRIVFFAGSPGAFTDLAADLSHALGGILVAIIRR